jgi:thiol-disulfide isomerase/thioredoxin
MNYIILALCILVIVVLVYKLWKPAMTPKRVVPTGEARVYFFFTNWCGFSKKAMPEWEKVEEQLKKTPYFGTTHIVPVRVNCEDEAKTCELYGVDAYPTFKVETKTALNDYTGKHKADSILAHLRSTFGKERESL